MLIFQIARIALRDQKLSDGIYDMSVRTFDDGDCLTTIPRPGASSCDCYEARLSVCVYSMTELLDIDEPGRAVLLIAADMERAKTLRSVDGGLRDNTKPSTSAALMLLRYRFSAANSTPTVWILQRELRRQGMDICFDDSAVLVGHLMKDTDGIPGRTAVNLVSRFDTLSDRDGSLINRLALGAKSVLIVGLGSVGATIACDLARSGVGRFIVADNERLEWGNVVRHVAGLSDAGRLKSRIVSDLIKDRNPNAEVREISLELGSSSKETYDEAFATADMVICATDNRTSRLICNRLSIKHQKKIIFGGLTGGAYAGMVFQCKPFESMCYHCFVSSFPEAAADRESNESEYSGGPDGHLALDIAPITNLMAKLALLELQRQLGAVPAGLDADLAAPWYLWINRREREYSELLPLGSPVKGPQILQWHPVPMDRLEECPHCGQNTSAGGSLT